MLAPAFPRHWLEPVLQEDGPARTSTPRHFSLAFSMATR
jgi:hypothetical protein